MRRSALAEVVLIPGALVLAACGGAAAAQAPPPSAQVRSPEQVYATTCGDFHGHNVGPVLRGRGLAAPAIVSIARHGRGAMPAFRPTEISNAELEALARWIQASPADAKEHGQ